MFHEMCDFDKMPWEVVEIGSDIDKLVQLVTEFIKKYYTDKPFVEELDESESPDPTKEEGGEDEGEYITPKMDPNSPFFM